LLLFYGAKGDIMAPATIFLSIIVSVPFLALSMMGNTIIRQRDKPPLQWCHDYSSTCKYCIRFCIYKITGFRAIWSSSATGIPISLFSFYSWYFIYKTELKLQAKDFKFHLPLSKKSPHLAWSLF
jgi:hypothetical protein